MKQTFCALAIVMGIFSAANCTGGKKTAQSVESLPASALQPYGRSLLNNGRLELISSAVHFSFSFEGKECKLFVSIPDPNGHNYLQYEMDGVYQKRVRIPGNAMQPLLFTAERGGKHTVTVYKTTEAHTGPIYVQKVEGKNIDAIATKDAPLIEFIGNSITCGAAADASEVPCNVGDYHDHHNALYAYGPRVARALRVNYIVSSVSGIGIYRNWNSDGPTMPQVYEKANLQAASQQLWDFNRYHPGVVSIALGTNDFSNGDGKRSRLPFDSAAFISAYIKFVQLVKSKYPDARIALLSSPMVGGNNRQLLQQCLNVVKQAIDRSYAGDKPVALFFFEPMQPHGCSGHPSVEDHAILAAQLTPFFRGLLD